MSAPILTTTSRLDPWKTWAVTIQRLHCEGPGVFSIDLAFDDASARDLFHYAPGQFNMLYVPGVGEAAVSIAGETSGRLLQHTIRSVGSVTGTIEAGGAGLSLGLRGPFGNSWPVTGDSRLPSSLHKHNVIIAAGGIGLAPLRSMVTYIAEHREQYGTVHILLGARCPDDLLYQGEFAEWSAKDIVVQTTVDRAPSNWNGHIGVVTLLLDRVEIAAPEATLVLTCGPEVMMRYVAQSATGRGIPEQNIWVTLERNMNCAIGLCGHCQMGPAILCREGPVFRYDRVSPWLRVQEL